jgi:hypothetical protein
MGLNQQWKIEIHEDYDGNTKFDNKRNLHEYVCALGSCAIHQVHWKLFVE